MAKKAARQKTVGRNTVSGRQLLEFIERIERIRENKKQLAEDEKQVFAELSAAGFDTRTSRAVIKRRGLRPADVEEAETMFDLYMHAIGMAKDTPLFRAVGQMSVDLAAREEVIEAFKLLTPNEGEIIVRIGKQPVRLWRDADGEAHAEDLIDKPEPASKSSRPAMPERPRREAPDVDAAGARELGRTAYRENQPITSNPFPWDDKRRPEFDAGWREASGSDGMGPEEDE